MAFFDYLSDSVNSKAEKIISEYKNKLRNSSDSTVRAKWEIVQNNPDIDSRMYDATYDEMRRRGLI